MTMPGVVANGPFNGHLLNDVGVAYATLAFALVAGLRDRVSARLATMLAAVNLCGHAALHAIAEFSGVGAGVATEGPGVYIPVFLAVAVALRFATAQPASRPR